MSLAAEILYLQALWAWLGWDLEAHLHLDSKAARGMAHRQGVGRVRTLAVKTLWLQERVRDGLKVFHVPGEGNVADVGTKPLAGPRLRRLSELAGLVLCRRGERPQMPQSKREMS